MHLRCTRVKCNISLQHVFVGVVQRSDLFAQHALTDREPCCWLLMCQWVKTCQHLSSNEPSNCNGRTGLGGRRECSIPPPTPPPPTRRLLWDSASICTCMHALSLLSEISALLIAKCTYMRAWMVVQVCRITHILDEIWGAQRFDLRDTHLETSWTKATNIYHSMLWGLRTPTWGKRSLVIFMIVGLKKICSMP